MEHRELTLGVLKHAREILSDPARWTKHVYARVQGSLGDPDNGWDLISGLDAGSACFCGLGALARSALELSGQEDLSPLFDFADEHDYVPSDEAGAVMATDHELAALRASTELRLTLLRSGRLAAPSWLQPGPAGGEKAILDWIQFPVFNDDPDTTHADVLAVFDETIARLEAQA